MTLGRKRQNGLRETQTSELHCSPVFVLLPANDEAPEEAGGTDEVAHKAGLLNSPGVSTAVVFCCAKRRNAGKFDSKTSLWKLEGDESAGRLLRRNRVASDGLCRTAVHGVTPVQ